MAEALERDARIISNTELEALLEETEADPELQAEIIRINTEARPQALRLALLAPLFAGFVGLATSTRLPRNPGHRRSTVARHHPRGEDRLVPQPPTSAAVRLQPAYDDPDAVVALIRGSGPYWPLARYARSAEERAASAEAPAADRSFRRGSARTSRSPGRPRSTGAELLLHNPAFVDAAHQVFDQDGIVRPTTVYVNLMTPCTYPFIAHVDVPAFPGRSPAITTRSGSSTR